MPVSVNGFRNKSLSSTRPLHVPHPERILYPELHITRADVLAYYAEVGPYILDQARNRALTVKKWPHGIEDKMFYQKHPKPGEPLVVNSLARLLAWVAQGALEWHAPLGTLSQPLIHDWAILDLDPDPLASWDRLVLAATTVKTLLDLMDVPFLLKTSGQKGLHFYVPIEPTPHHHVTHIMRQWAESVVQTIPEAATVARLKRDRGPRIYLDYLQNGFQRTTVMAYSLRATPKATVSMPIRFEDIGYGIDYWTMGRVSQRLHQEGNLFRWQGPRVPLEEVAKKYGFNTLERDES